jgi:hypothetical protein
VLASHRTSDVSVEREWCRDNALARDANAGIHHRPGESVSSDDPRTPLITIRPRLTIDRVSLRSRRDGHVDGVLRVARHRIGEAAGVTQIRLTRSWSGPAVGPQVLRTRTSSSSDRRPSPPRFYVYLSPVPPHFIHILSGDL